MVSKVDICNMSLANCRAGSINSITESSNEAEQCRLFYDTARKFVLEGSPWKFANKVAALALFAEVPQEWLYSYAKPTDCLKMRRILPAYLLTSGGADTIIYRQDYYGKDWTVIDRFKVPYEMGLNSDGAQAIWTNEPEAYAAYTVDQETTGLFTASFVTALSHYLTTMIATPVIGRKEGAQIRQDHMQLYQFTVNEAVKNNEIERYDGPPRESDMITVRN